MFPQGLGKGLAGSRSGGGTSSSCQLVVLSLVVVVSTTGCGVETFGPHGPHLAGAQACLQVSSSTLGSLPKPPRLRRKWDGPWVWCPLPACIAAPAVLASVKCGPKGVCWQAPLCKRLGCPVHCGPASGALEICAFLRKRP